jgi:curved DNA-binding protein CbpA
MSAFDVLRISPGLIFSEEDLRSAFRAAGKELHPDAGGGDGDFASLKESLAIISSPSRRLAHWLSLEGIEVEARGLILPGLMDVFGKIGALSQVADSLIRRREAARSSLGKAMLEPEIQDCLHRIEEMIAEVDDILASECAVFSQWMNMPPSADEGSIKVRNLAFLEKWKASLKGLYSRML